MNKNGMVDVSIRCCIGVRRSLWYRVSFFLQMIQKSEDDDVGVGDGDEK